MEFKDCYMRHDLDNGRVFIGNDCIEKVIHINGAFLRTERIWDRKNGKVWESDKRLWQHCPVFDMDEQPVVKVSAVIHEEKFGIQSHLKTVIEFTGSRGTVWYYFIVFPGIPFVYCQSYVDQKETALINREGKAGPDCSGIESRYNPEPDKDIICDPDTLDCIPLGNHHLELETFRLYDKTDRNDLLLERHVIPVYRNGQTEREGNIFRITDYPAGDSLLLVKHSPTPGSALNRHNKDIVLYKNAYASLMGTGVDYGSVPAERIPCYGSAVGTGKAEDILEEYWRYSNAFCGGDPDKRLFIMSNTWGDRNRDMRLNEGFMLQEIEQAHKLGVDIVQIDDGWQQGISANSGRNTGGSWEGYYRDNSNFWQVNTERFPHGLEPIVEKAKSYGLEIGLWFGPDSSQDFENVEKDIDTLWGLHQQYGIRYFKLDGLYIRSKLAEKRFIHMMEELKCRSGGEIRFNLDITAKDRFGYLYQTMYGTLFVENRYTDWGNYYPHNTFRNLWSLSAVIPARRLQMELLNHRRNPDQYEGMQFAPSEYRIDYLFASVLPANPLVWMELSGLAKEDLVLLSELITIYKQYSSELFQARVIPIGDEPNGMSFSGYFCDNRDKKTGHLLLFREQTDDSEYNFRLPIPYGNMRFSVLYQSDPTEFSYGEQGLAVKFSCQRSFIWMAFCRE